MKKIISTQLLRKLIKIQLLENYKKNILLEKPQEYNREQVNKYLNINSADQTNNSSQTTPTQIPTLSLTPTPTKPNLNYYDDYEKYNNGKIEDLKIKLTEPISNKESYRKIIDNLFTNSQYQNVLKYLKIPPHYIVTTIDIQPDAESLEQNKRNQYKMLFSTSIDDVKNQIIDQLDTLFQSKQIPANYTIIFPMKYIKRKIVNFIVDDSTAKNQIDTDFKQINFHNLLDENGKQINQESFNALPSYNITKPIIKKEKKTGLTLSTPEEVNVSNKVVTDQLPKTDQEIWKGIADNTTNLKSCFEELKLVDKIQYNTSTKVFTINMSFSNDEKEQLKNIGMPYQIINRNVTIDDSKDNSKIYVNGTKHSIENEQQLKNLFKNAIQNKQIITIGGPVSGRSIIIFNFAR